jgi:hypothetical protein
MDKWINKKENRIKKTKEKIKIKCYHAKISPHPFLGIYIYFFTTYLFFIISR